ncbi:MAG: T9SS type A sorting domain-containing protein [Fimbriimonadaceae bacterium]|nr:T9SS type A sorting domain-containing protein [Chitinophagales bacterium]
MKLRLQITTAILSIAPFIGFAQQIDNGDLELWAPIAGHTGGGESPVGPFWSTPDELAPAFGVSEILTAKTTDSHSGEFAAELTTKTITIPFVGDLTLPGALVLGEIQFSVSPVPSAAIIGGFPISVAADGFMGYYKYAPAAGDTFNISVAAKKDGVIIGGGEFRSDVAVSTYTLFEITITYGVPEIPDTILIGITSSGGFDSAIPGSVLHVDDLALTGLVSADDLAGSGIKPNIFPNPANDFINIYNPLKTNALIELYDLAGNKVDVIEIKSGLNTINVANYAAGIYMFRMTDAGDYLYAGKFKVAR